MSTTTYQEEKKEETLLNVGVKEQEKSEKETVTANVNAENAVGEDAYVKMEIVIDILQEYCVENSKHENLRRIAHVLNNDPNGKLTGRVLAGGFTNYTYKIYPDIDDKNKTNSNDCNDDNDDSGTPAVFAKLAFSHALWCPDKSQNFDLERQQTEFDMMERFVREMGGPGVAPVPSPYLLIDSTNRTASADDNDDGHQVKSSLLVTEWAKGDEQWGNQFIDGQIDQRVLKKAADTFAAIHTADYDVSLNHNAISSLQESSGKLFQALFLQCLDPSTMKENSNNKFNQYIHNELGVQRYLQILDGLGQASKRKDYLIHGDAHTFNMLVERKPNPSRFLENHNDNQNDDDDTDNNNFGTFGSFFLCDWEIAHAGPDGRDIGTLIGFPLIASFFHSAQGHVNVAKHLADSILDTFIDEYVHAVTEKKQKQKQKQQRTDNDVDDAADEDVAVSSSYFSPRRYVSILSWCGHWLFLFYMLGIHKNLLNCDGLSDETIQHMTEKVGILGLQLMELGFVQQEEEEQQQKETNDEKESNHVDKEVFSNRRPDADTLNSLNKLRGWFRKVIETEQNKLNEEFEQLSAVRNLPRRSRRRPSMLRASGRRVSDASLTAEISALHRQLSTRVLNEDKE